MPIPVSSIAAAQTGSAVASRARDARQTSATAKFIFAGLMALLLFGPLAFGAMQPWAMMTQQIAAALLAAIWIVQWISAPALAPHGNPLYWPWLALALVAVSQVALGIPAYFHATLVALLAAVAYFLIFFLANESFRYPEHVRRAGRIFTIFGAAVAAYSMIQAFAAPTKLLGFYAPRVAGVIYGPYVNHSHYAGLMELLLPFLLVMAFRRNLTGSQRMLYAAAALLIAASVFLSESRGGMLAVLAEFIFLSALFAIHSSDRAGRAWLAVCAGIFVAFLMWFGAERLAENLATFRHPGVSIAMRRTIAHDTLRMAGTRPWLGWGIGNWETVYPQFRSFYSNLQINAAHNDYLQFLAETGIAGAAAALCFLIAIFASARRHFSRWHADSVSSAKLAALAGIGGLLVHSFSDFNLHVPANAALFVALCALTTVRSETHA